MKKKNYFKGISLFCGLVLMCLMSSCASMMDFLYGPPPPPHYHYCPPPPPPPRHHHHPHYRYLSDIEVNTTGDYDLASIDVSTEPTASIL